MASTQEFDLIVVGGGFAGLTAANRAQELGLRTVLIEKSADKQYECNSRLGGGVIHVAFHSMLDDPDKMVQAIDRISGGFTPEPLARALSVNAARVVDWLKGMGAEFGEIEPTEGWKDHVFKPLGFHNNTDGLTWKGLGSDVTMQRMEARYAQAGGRFMRGIQADSLTMAGGRCVGLTAKGPQGPVELRGPVVLADGGFQGNTEMLRRFVTANPETLLARGPRTSSGDGIRMAEAAGAELIGMKYFYGHVLSADALKNERLSPFPLLDFLAGAGIIVDGRGKRFCDESMWGVYIANAIAHNDMGGTPQVIFDDEIWNTTGKHFFSPANPNLLERGGTLHKADDLDGLAKLAGLPAAALKATVEAYNAAFDAGRQDKLTPPRGAGRIPGKPIRKGPFYAAPGCAAITHTQGGVAVDAEARVLKAGGQPIPGLYAAGDICGGLEGGPRVSYIGALNQAVVYGMLAAERAAADRG